MNDEPFVSSSKHGGADPEQTLDTPASAAPVARARALPPTIGRYRIVRLIAEGGMGAVYEAEQDNPQRRVALKLIKSGFSTPDQRRRFELEAQALGRLQHPGIAQIYEAGSIETDYGPQPYFAMELIDGEGLLQYADKHRLNSRPRLELIAQICDAVQHAHQRGIIHRDLKPANILVDTAGHPRILDFGVAHISDPDNQATRQTEMGQIVGTLAYMSPEQVSGDPLDVDLRADVYALGVILYQLLAGRLPFDVNRETLHRAVQIIRDQDVPSLSSVSRVFRGDIETIVAKALDKEKARRYASASELAADIRRYLGDEPIQARPPSTLYQLGKFARRHRALVSGIAAVFVVLIAGIAASSFELVRARRAERAARQSELQVRSERDRAVAAEAAATNARDRAVDAEHTATSARDRAIKAEALATSERDRAVAAQHRADSEAAIASAISNFLQNDLLAKASVVEQRRGDKPDPEIKVRTLLDRAAEEVHGKFAGQPQVEAALERTIGNAYRRIGLLPEGQLHLEKSLALYRSTLGDRSAETLSAANSLGDTYVSAGKYGQAESLLKDAVERYNGTRSSNDAATLRAWTELSEAYIGESKFRDAEPLLTRVLDQAQRTLPADDETTLTAQSDLARIYFVTGRLPQAEQLLLKLIDEHVRVYGPDHPYTLGKMNNLAVLYQRLYRYPEAEAIYNKVLASYLHSYGPEHPETLNTENNLGVLYTFERKYAQAETLFQQVLAGWRKLLGPEHPRTLTLLGNIAILKQYEGKYGEAEAMMKSLLETRRRVLGPEHIDTADSLSILGALYLEEGKFGDAEAPLVQAFELRRRRLGARHVSTLTSMDDLAELRIRQQRYTDAERLLRECLETQKQVMPDNFLRFRSEALLGESLAGEHRYAEAEPLLVSGYDGMRQRESKASPRIAVSIREALQALVRVYSDSGKPEQAAERKKQLLELPH